MTADLAPVAPGHTLQRRVWHVVGGLLVLAPYAMGLVSRPLYTLVLAAAVATLLATDLVRLRQPRVNALFARLFRGLLLPRDLVRLNGTTFFLAGILAAVIFFAQPVAVAAVLFLVVGDFVAGVVGRRWGKVRFRPGGKSLEGSAACFLACLGVALPIVGWGPALGGALTAALVEHAELPLDDNLLIPPAAGAMMAWLA